MGNICSQKEHARAVPHELIMRQGARGSQLVLNLGSLSWSTALAHPLEACDGKLRCLVPCTAGQRSREWASVLGPATKFLSEFGYTWSKASINHLDASFLGDGYVGPNGCWMSFLWCQVAPAAEPVLLKGDVLLVLPHAACQPMCEGASTCQHTVPSWQPVCMRVLIRVPGKCCQAAAYTFQKRSPVLPQKGLL